MNRPERAWKRFEETGCITDYLAYRQLECSQRTEGGLQNADFDRRHRSENEAGRQ